jgi:hypothetical protein
MMPKQPKLNFSQGERVLANVRCEVNASKIRNEKRDGRDVIVVPSYTLPDNIIMNGIRYPAEEIEKGYQTLENTPAPLGHPTVDGLFVSARSPLGLNLGYFGAWNANVERKDGRVYVEKIIDVERAKESKMGQRVLDAINEGKPIHTSTGVYLNIRECKNSDLADYEGYDMEFDHDAILLDEEGAATPEQGVGMLVNSAKDKQGNKITVVNSSITERYDDMIDYYGMELLSAMDRKESASRWERVKSAIMEALSLNREEGSKAQEETMPDQKNEGLEQFAARLDKIETTVNSVAESVEKMSKTVNETVEAMNAERAAKRIELVNKVVEAELLTKEEADQTPEAVLQKMLANAAKTDKVEPAPGIFGAFNSGKEKVSLAEDWEN